MIGFAAPSIRAALCPLSDNAFWLIGVQLLDGVGAGIYGALIPVAFVVFFRFMPETRDQNPGRCESAALAVERAVGK